MQEPSGKHAVLAVQTIRNNIMASTLLASTAITLSSLIAVLMSGGSRGGGGGGLLPGAPLVVGATGDAALSAKFFAILVCFLVAFLLNLQSIRYYSHTSTLVNVPLRAHRLRRPGLAVDYVTGTLNRGSYFWSLGVRAFYFSCPVFL
jgi:preprotein translocase subunit SecG